MLFNEDRKFGVEIEFLAPAVSISELAQAITREGVVCVAEQYNHSTRGYWKIITDSSCGYELVSPPMSGTDGLRQIRTVCKVLNDKHVKVDRRCGLHVHHDIRDYTVDDAKRLAYFYRRFENIFDSFVPKSRRGDDNTYCRTISQVINFSALDSYTTIEQLANSVYTRYGKLNFQPFVRQGTVEFRHHSGTVDAEKIVNWVVLTNAVVNRAQGQLRETGVTRNSWYDFQKVFSFYGNLPADDFCKTAAAFFRQRRKVLA